MKGNVQLRKLISDASRWAWCDLTKSGGNPARAPICLTHLADGDDKRWEAGLRRKGGLLEKFAKIGLISRERARLIEITEQPCIYNMVSLLSL